MDEAFGHTVCYWVPQKLSQIYIELINLEFGRHKVASPYFRFAEVRGQMRHSPTGTKPVYSVKKPVYLVKNRFI